MSVRKGQTYYAPKYRLTLTVKRVSGRSDWADVLVTPALGDPWTKRQYLTAGAFPFEVLDVVTR